MLKKCTPLWRKARFEINMYKAHQVRTTFGSWDVEKVHAVVARSTFEVKMLKTLGVRTTFGSSDLEKVHAVVARSTFWSQHVKTLGVRTTFGGSDVVSRGRSTRLWILSTVRKNMRVLQHFDKRWQAWDIWRWSAKTHFPWQAQYKRHVHERGWEVRVQISRGVTFWSIRSVGLLRWFCMIGAEFRMTWQPVFVAGAVL